MRKYFQPYYLIALLVGGGIFWFDASNRKQASIFYGFAENKETEVNFNYPVIVKQILVTEGQKLSEGDIMFHLQRVQPKDQHTDEDFKISELQSEHLKKYSPPKEQIWKVSLNLLKQNT